mgnify:CR=1 FL=1
MEKELADLFVDQDFEMLELALQEPNIFKALNVSRKEIRHSNFLAYLLAPNETHGLSEIFLRRFLRDIFLNAKNNSRNLFDIEQINFADVLVLREWRNIDILIKLENDIIVIENKVNIQDHSDQLNRYKQIIDEQYPDLIKHYVYLTPFGSEPKDEKALDHYILYSYIQVVDNLNSILEVYHERMNEKILTYAKDYIQTIRREIIMEEKLNEIALQLYTKHKDAIEFIFENRPDPASDLYPFFEKAIIEKGYTIGSKNKGYIRFTSQHLDQDIKKTGTGWKNKESFLFEIDYYWSDKNAVFKAVISPCEPDIRKKIIEKVSKNPHYYIEPKGEKWVVFCVEKEKFKASEVVNEENDKIEDKVKKIVEKFASKIDMIIKDLESVF